jgi:acyl carrier protein
MANPLPNEKYLFEKIEQEQLGISKEIWDLLYNRIGDDITAINLICQCSLMDEEAIPINEAMMIIQHTHHIKDIINKVTMSKIDNLPFPEFIDSLPLHPVLRDMLTHYIGNDIYIINLIVQDSIDPADPHPVPPDVVRKIVEHASEVSVFMNKLCSATSRLKDVCCLEGDLKNSTSSGSNLKSEWSRGEVFIKVFNAISRNFKFCDESKIVPKADFKKDLGFDLPAMLRLAEILEKTFSLEILRNDMNQIKMVDDLVEYIYNKLGSN